MGDITGLLLFAPIMIITALAIKLTSPGPVIFKQNRFGIKGARFPFYKFRSMYSDVDDELHREYVTNLIKGEHEKINQGDEEDPLYKIKDDPRVTKVGKIIRKTSIDELPQFFNVLKGEMSLVGPRMVTGGNVTGITDQLVREGLVTRAALPDDRRALVVRLTPAGRRSFLRMAESHETWVVELVSGLSAPERKHLFELLAELKRSITVAQTKHDND